MKDLKTLLEIPLSNILLTKVTVGEISYNITELHRIMTAIVEGDNKEAYELCRQLFIYNDNLIDRELQLEQYINIPNSKNYGEIPEERTCVK